MTHVFVTDASCLIDLRKGRLLHLLRHVPFRFIVPLSIRESELFQFTPREWALLDCGGMETLDLSPERMKDVFALKQRHSRLSANDCICLVTTLCHEDGILLTGDRLLRSVAEQAGVRVHGVLWIIDALRAANACKDTLLVSALEIWKADRSVFLPRDEIERRIQHFRP